MALLAIDLGSPKLAQSEAFAALVRDLVDRLIMVNRECVLELPPLYSSGVRYQFDGRTFRDCFAVKRRGAADCASLPAWRIAELYMRGEDRHARPVISWKTLPDGRRLFHVRVRRGNKQIEDPSLALGMQTPWLDS